MAINELENTATGHVPVFIDKVNDRYVRASTDNGLPVQVIGGVALTDTERATLATAIGTAVADAIGPYLGEGPTFAASVSAYPGIPVA